MCIWPNFLGKYAFYLFFLYICNFIALDLFTTSDRHYFLSIWQSQQLFIRTSNRYTFVSAHVQIRDFQKPIRFTRDNQCLPLRRTLFSHAFHSTFIHTTTLVAWFVLYLFGYQRHTCLYEHAHESSQNVEDRHLGEFFFVNCCCFHGRVYRMDAWSELCCKCWFGDWSLFQSKTHHSLSARLIRNTRYFWKLDKCPAFFILFSSKSSN